MLDDVCTHCGGTQWSLRLAPDEACWSLAPRDVVAVWCATCGQLAPAHHPLWPAKEEPADA